MSHIRKVHLYYQKEGKSRSRDACMLSHFSCVHLFVTLWTCSLPGSSVHGQEYCSGYPFSRGSSPPGIKPTSLMSPALASGFFTTVPLGKPHIPPRVGIDLLQSSLTTKEGKICQSYKGLAGPGSSEAGTISLREEEK